MTIPVTNRNDAIGNDSTATYPYGFKIFAATDLEVKVRAIDSGAETTLVYPAQFSVTNVGNKNGGSVVLSDVDGAWQDPITAFLRTGYTLTARRVRPLTQSSDIRNQGGFFADVHEDTFDHLMMVDQQQQDEIDRSFKLPTTEDGTPASTTLPAASQRANKFFGFDAGGLPTVLTGSVTGVPIENVVQVIDTVALLKALAKPAVAMTYYVRGYYAIGDHGGGLFRWNAADASTDNAGSIIAANAGGVGRWNRILDNGIVPNIRMFGVKGDAAVTATGVITGTDDTVAIQNCIDFCLQNKMVLARALALTCKITNTIHIGYGVTGFATIVCEGDMRDDVGNWGASWLWAGTLDRPAVNIQGGRQSGLRNVNVQYHHDFVAGNGYWTIQSMVFGVTTQFEKTPNIANWTPAGAVTDSTRPFCGVAVDAYAGAAPGLAYPAATYPAWLGVVAQYNKTNSSNSIIEGCGIKGFYIGAMITSQNTGNADFTKMNRSVINFNAINVRSGHQNGRMVDLTGAHIGVGHTCYTNIGPAGVQGGNTVRLDGVCFDYCYQLFDVGSVGAFHVSNIYGEGVVRIGRTYGGAVNAPIAAQFTSLNIVFARKAFAALNTIVPQNIYEGFGEFKNCNFHGLYGIEQMTDQVGPVVSNTRLRDCYVDNVFARDDFPTAAAPESVGLRYTGGLLLSIQASFDMGEAKVRNTKFSFAQANSFVVGDYDYNSGADWTGTIYSIAGKMSQRRHEYMTSVHTSGIYCVLNAIAIVGRVLSATVVVVLNTPPRVGDILTTGNGTSYTLLVQTYNGGTGAITCLICNAYSIDAAGALTLFNAVPANGGQWRMLRKPRGPRNYDSAGLSFTAGLATVTMRDVNGGVVPDHTIYYAVGDTIMACPFPRNTDIDLPPFLGYAVLTAVAAGNMTMDKNAIRTVILPAIPGPSSRHC